MATLTLAVSSPDFGTGWTATISNITGTNVINDLTQYPGSIQLNLTVPSSLSDLGGAIATVGRYPGDYVTWQTAQPTSFNQYSTSGFSLDIWSSSFKSAIDSGATWQSVVGTYDDLNSDKYSLLYNYNNGGTALVYTKGGTLTASYSTLNIPS